MSAFPRCKEVGLKPKQCSEWWIIPREALMLLYATKGKRWANKFNKFYGCQTQFGEGPFAHDVEAVLERMVTGKKIGTQSLEGWD